MLQRFLNRDPLAEQGGLNLYAYCGNNPVNLYDPLGLCWWDNLWNYLTGDSDNNDDNLFPNATARTNWVAMKGGAFSWRFSAFYQW